MRKKLESQDLLEYDEAMRDYKVDLYNEKGKFIEVFGSNNELLDLRNKNQKIENSQVFGFTFFSSVVGTMVFIVILFCFDNFQRKLSRAFPAYKLFFGAKSTRIL